MTSVLCDASVLFPGPVQLYRNVTNLGKKNLKVASTATFPLLLHALITT